MLSIVTVFAQLGQVRQSGCSPSTERNNVMDFTDVLAQIGVTFGTVRSVSLVDSLDDVVPTETLITVTYDTSDPELGGPSPGSKGS